MKLKVAFQDESMTLDVNFAQESLQQDVVLIEEESNVNVQFDSAEIIDIGSELDPYEGAYFVTPGVNSQTLNTDGKRMTANVFVGEIPFIETGNLGGGYTAIIGG